MNMVKSPLLNRAPSTTCTVSLVAVQNHRNTGSPEPEMKASWGAVLTLAS